MKKLVQSFCVPAVALVVGFGLLTASGCSDKSTLHIASPGVHIVHDGKKAKIVIVVQGKQSVAVDAEFSNIQITEMGAFINGDVITLKSKVCGQYQVIKVANQLVCPECSSHQSDPMCPLEPVDLSNSAWSEIPVSKLEDINIAL